ncbi:MAG: BON domain-containing protein [Planctomycetes bacterium]|nr:BON domain-containing protein [Planctomycetota bacterium]
MAAKKFHYLGVLVVCAVLAVDSASAQLFGARRLGDPVSRRPGPGSAAAAQDDVGTLQGHERFLRRNRRPTDFVGTDLRDLQRFIGQLQASVRGGGLDTTEGLRERVDRSTTINQPLAPLARGTMYHPRLTIDVGFDVTPATNGLAERRILDQLVDIPRLSGACRIEVLLAERTAILRGEVPSAADRDLAEVLVSFEPGISTVQNDLVVNPLLPPSLPDSLDAARQKKPRQAAWTTMSQSDHGRDRLSGGSAPMTARSY